MYTCPAKEKHQAKQRYGAGIAIRERVKHGIAYHCECDCGATWVIGVLLADDDADAIAGVLLPPRTGRLS